MMPGSVCRHLKIAGRIIISRLFHVASQQPRKLQHIPDFHKEKNNARNLLIRNNPERFPYYAAHHIVSEIGKGSPIRIFPYSLQQVFGLLDRPRPTF
jgi:hypothetical protein